MASFRLDKILSEYTPLSRREAAELIRRGQVEVAGDVIRDPGRKFETDGLVLRIRGEEIQIRNATAFMLNKPVGYISATEDPKDPTVLDLIRQEDRHPPLYPAGRLDKDGEGLMILTSDGDLCHRIISPRSEIYKEYRIRVAGTLTKADAEAVAAGIRLDEETICRPGSLIILKSGPESIALIRICEGKFHQVKRMMRVLGKPVLSLKRESIGGLRLDSALSPGEYRPLSSEEIQLIFQ